MIFAGAVVAVLVLDPALQAADPADPVDPPGPGGRVTGGGFAAGLVFGAVVTLRTVAGLQRPTHATGLIAAGMLLVAAVAVAPLLWGDPLLDQKVVSLDVPLLGKIKSGSALPFDIGVTVIVVGLVIALLDGLSATALDAESRRDVSRQVRP